MLAVEEFSLDCLQAQCQNAFPKMNLAPPFVHLEILLQLKFLLRIWRKMYLKQMLYFVEFKPIEHFTFLMMHKLFLSDSFLRKSVLLRLVDVLQFSTFQSGISATKN